MPDNNLPELRDIHLPDGVSAFPPAYGWWVILAAVLAALALIYVIRLLRRKSKKLYALYLLQNVHGINTIASTIQISAILRRICVFKYPRAAALAGSEWLTFLNSKSKRPLTGKAADLLLAAPYIRPQSKGFERADVERLRQFCREWIGENL